MTQEIKSAYLGEALLIRWGETATAGRTVTFQLDEHVGASHPFKGLKCGPNGQRLKLVAVLIDENEQPVEPDQARRCVPKKAVQDTSLASGVDEKPSHSDREWSRSQKAFLMCQDPEFQDWVNAECAAKAGRIFQIEGMVPDADEERANLALKELLGITSKKELDTDPHAAARFDSMRVDFDVRGLVR